MARVKWLMLGITLGIVLCVILDTHLEKARNAETQRLIQEACEITEQVVSKKYMRIGAQIAADELLGKAEDVQRMNMQMQKLREMLNDALLNIEVDRAMQKMLEREANGAEKKK